MVKGILVFTALFGKIKSLVSMFIEVLEIVTVLRKKGDSHAGTDVWDLFFRGGINPAYSL